jgi:hypothetical protein
LKDAEPGRRLFNFQFSIFNFAALAAVVAIYILLRLPLLSRHTLPLGWNSDSAIFGLMAKAIFARRDFPIFFWGQSYMGPLTSWVTALVALVTRAVDPFALRAAVLLEGAGAIVFFWLGLRRAFGPRAVAIAMLWVAIGPAFLLRFAIAPIGAEQMFLLSAILFWFGARNWFVFGVLSGFGWWMNQGVVFVIAAVLLVETAGSAWFGEVLERVRRRGRRRPAEYLIGLLLLDALLGAAYELGIHVPTFFLIHPVLDPIVAAVAVLLISLLPLPFPPLRMAALFAAGFVLGYAPVIIGAFTHAYSSNYPSGIAGITIGELPRHVREVLPDFFPFAIGLVPLAASVWRRQSCRRFMARSMPAPPQRAVALTTILLSFLFYLGSARVHTGQERYMAAALPMVFAFAAEELVRWRWVGVAAAAVFAIALAVPRMAQIRDVQEARSEGYVSPNRDPRVILADIERAGYCICYADYWLGYKLEWVSGGRVEFIPWSSYDRTPDESRRRIAAPGPKCFVRTDGTIRPFTSADADTATGRAARQRLRRSGFEGLASRPPL